MVGDQENLYEMCVYRECRLFRPSSPVCMTNCRVVKVDIPILSSGYQLDCKRDVKTV